MKSMMASRISCTTQRAVRSPQVLFFKRVCSFQQLGEPRFCAGAFAPELQAFFDTGDFVKLCSCALQKPLTASSFAPGSLGIATQAVAPLGIFGIKHLDDLFPMGPRLHAPEMICQNLNLLSQRPAVAPGGYSYASKRSAPV
jgi:hypothetical protein